MYIGTLSLGRSLIVVFIAVICLHGTSCLVFVIKLYSLDGVGPHLELGTGIEYIPFPEIPGEHLTQSPM